MEIFYSVLLINQFVLGNILKTMVIFYYYYSVHKIFYIITPYLLYIFNKTQYLLYNEYKTKIFIFFRLMEKETTETIFIFKKVKPHFIIL